MREISAASQHQSEGIERVHQVISDMDKVTQQNAALVQQAASASDSMQAHALELARLMMAVDLSRNSTQ
jgi:methyl-accepting chemotaxis protein